MTTAAQIITSALRLFGIIDQTESAQPADIANNVIQLNDLLRAEQADGACQYLIRRITAQLPAGVNGQTYSFSIGTADAGYLVQQDAVAVRQIWMNDINTTLTAKRAWRRSPTWSVRRTRVSSQNGIQSDRQTAPYLLRRGMPPRVAVPALIEYGARLAAITAADGSDTVALPPEGITMLCCCSGAASAVRTAAAWTLSASSRKMPNASTLVGGTGRAGSSG
jgi:hypothetical protein